MLGPEPCLDACQREVLDMFWTLRRQTPSDQGIRIEEDDFVIARLLSALDHAYLSDQAARLKEVRDEARSQRDAPPIR